MRSGGVTGRRTSVRQRGRGERGERECQRQRVLGRMVGYHYRAPPESGGPRRIRVRINNPPGEHQGFPYWKSGAEPDVTWQSARAALLAGDAAQLAAEQPGFTYLGGRDITGFIDGTANRPVRRAADVALVPPGHTGEGGSHVLTMRWVHDLVAFSQLSVREQHRVIGRTRADSIELSDAEKPRTAHIARVEMTVDGQELKIFDAAFRMARRRSTACTSLRSAPSARDMTRCLR